MKYNIIAKLPTVNGMSRVRIFTFSTSKISPNYTAEATDVSYRVQHSSTCHQKWISR